MSAFYGQVEGSAKTSASRRETKDIKVSAQSWNGSIQTRLYYDGGDLMVDITIGEGSSFTGYSYFHGTLEELKGRLKG